MEKHPCVYILASRRFGTLYVGVTSNLIQRIYSVFNIKELLDNLHERARYSVNLQR